MNKPCYTKLLIASLSMRTWTEKEEADRLCARFSGVNRAEFARTFQVPGGAAMIYQHITGRRPISLEAAQAYALGFSCPIEEISPRLANEARKALAISRRPNDATPAVGARKAWVIGNGQGGMPDRIWTDGDHPVGASDKYAEVATDDGHAFVVGVRGDSMIPRYQPGEYALVEPGTVPEIEDDVLVRLASGETMLKRLLSRRNGIRLGSYNSVEVMSYREEDITWMYYVSHPIPARKIKHWIESTEYSGEDRRQEKNEPITEERRNARPLGSAITIFGSGEGAQKRKPKGGAE